MLAGALLLAACAPRRPEPVPLPPKPIGETTQAPARGPDEAAIPAGSRAYEIDPQRSTVTIKVYRAGSLARLGHNHVVTSRQVTGVAWEGRDPAGSGFVIHVPVAAMVVDDPVARAAAGPDFEGEVPQSARDGTRANMMRPEVLDAENYAEVTVRSTGLDGTWEQPVAVANVTIRDATRRVEVPMQLQRAGDTLEAKGAFKVLQSDFGITPFSVAGGAIRVADELEIGFDIVAVR